MKFININSNSFMLILIIIFMLCCDVWNYIDAQNVLPEMEVIENITTQPTSIIVKYKPGRFDDVKQAAAANGFTLIDQHGIGSFLVFELPINTSLSMDQAIEFFNNLNSVEFAEPNHIISIADDVPEPPNNKKDTLSTIDKLEKLNSLSKKHVFVVLPKYHYKKPVTYFVACGQNDIVSLNFIMVSKRDFLPIPNDNSYKIWNGDTIEDAVNAAYKAIVVDTLEKNLPVFFEVRDLKKRTSSWTKVE